MEDYKVRMANEYKELKERYEKLHKLLVKHDADTLEFDLNCPVSLLREQETVMYRYLFLLEVRAQFEGVDLS